MISPNFHADWIRNTKSPYFRGTLLKRLDTALQGYCAAATPLTTQALITAWDNWQESKALKGGWWKSERNTLSTGYVVVRLANEMQLLKPAAGVARGAVCYDSPHLTRAVNQAPPIALTLHADAGAVWTASRLSGYQGDTFIGITQRSTGVCHMLPTYQRVDRRVVTPPSLIPRIAQQPKLLGWALQGNAARGGGQFRFVSGRNLNVFDLGNPAGHEPRDLPPAWAKAISDCVSEGLHITAAAAFTHGTSGVNHRTHTRTFQF